MSPADFLIISELADFFQNFDQRQMLRPDIYTGCTFIKDSLCDSNFIEKKGVS